MWKKVEIVGETKKYTVDLNFWKVLDAHKGDLALYIESESNSYEKETLGVEWHLGIAKKLFFTY